MVNPPESQAFAVFSILAAIVALAAAVVLTWMTDQIPPGREGIVVGLMAGGLTCCVIFAIIAQATYANHVSAFEEVISALSSFTESGDTTLSLGKGVGYAFAVLTWLFGLPAVFLAINFVARDKGIGGF